MGGLAFDADDNLFYSDGFSLYGLDLTTGAGTLIGAHGVGQRIAGLTFIPEPGTATLLGLGMLGLAAWRRR